jgi:hypothetical protein
VVVVVVVVVGVVVVVVVAVVVVEEVAVEEEEEEKKKEEDDSGKSRTRCAVSRPVGPTQIAPLVVGALRGESNSVVANDGEVAVAAVVRFSIALRAGRDDIHTP